MLLDVVANKWAALAISALAEGPQRFGALQRGRKDPGRWPGRNGSEGVAK